MNINKGIYQVIATIKPVLNKILPEQVRRGLSRIPRILEQKMYLEKVGTQLARETKESIDLKLEKGVNIIGYARSPVGIGESVRGMAAALKEVGVPVEIIAYEDYIINAQNANKINADRFRYNTNVFHINHGEMRKAGIYIEAEKWKGRYNIGYWAWELAEFPAEYTDCFEILDEVWVGSEFVRKAVAEKATIPVTISPSCLHLPNLDNALTRKSFNLPENAFLFLNMFDFKSLSERKNPKAAIKAFRKAFASDDLSVGMVIKVKKDPTTVKEMQTLKTEIKDSKNIYIIEETLSREEINSLLEMIDAAVSLHRSEGFGLLMAEAMYFGKPVIATNWSGNVDYMNNENSCPVNYKLIKIEKDCGPFKAGQEWAEADTDHASKYMQRLVNDSEYYQRISEKGRATMIHNHSPKAIGELCKKRLAEIGLIEN